MAPISLPLKIMMKIMRMNVLMKRKNINLKKKKMINIIMKRKKIVMIV